ncbi:ABC transporter permease [Isoptericola jiangsuensis]|uniref:ABC transporter permease n=1 Tax=Isoptericola jiangsuensis TaxID=548579 RepID=UPI003AB0B13B
MTAAAAAPAAPRTDLARGSTLTGTGALVRFMLRRDRVRLTVWSASMVAFYAYFTFALDTVFADEAAQQARATVMETPAGIVMGGPGYGIDHYTTGVAMANEGITWVVLALAVLSILHVVRHTRTEEESNRSELVRAAVVGRHAHAVAAVLTLLLAQTVIAVLSALSMVAVGDLAVTDSFAMTVGSGLSAMVFGAVALVACQVTEHARGALGISLAVFGAAFVVRAAGDMRELGGSTLSWFSPIAWAQQMRAFVDLRWWPAALSVVAIVALLWIAAVLASHRDFGGALLRSRPGRPEARASLRGPFALTWLQQRGALLWSCLGLGLMWFATGTLMPEIGTMIDDLVADNAAAQQIFGADPSQLSVSFLAVMIMFAALCCAGYAVVMTQRPKAEETSGRGEIMFSHPVGRTRWLGAQVAVAAIGTTVLLAVSVYATWLGAVVVGWDDQSFGDYTVVVWTYLAALAVFVGLVVALYGWAPRLTGLGWALVAYALIVGMFGGLFDLPDWAYRISPFDWVPDAFSGDFSAGDVALLWGVAAVLVVLGFVGFRRRDLQTG